MHFTREIEIKEHTPITIESIPFIGYYSSYYCSGYFAVKRDAQHCIKAGKKAESGEYLNGGKRSCIAPRNEVNINAPPELLELCPPTDYSIRPFSYIYFSMPPRVYIVLNTATNRVHVACFGMYICRTPALPIQSRRPTLFVYSVIFRFSLGALVFFFALPKPLSSSPWCGCTVAIVTIRRLLEYMLFCFSLFYFL